MFLVLETFFRLIRSVSLFFHILPASNSPLLLLPDKADCRVFISEFLKITLSQSRQQQNKRRLLCRSMIRHTPLTGMIDATEEVLLPNLTNRIYPSTTDCKALTTPDKLPEAIAKPQAVKSLALKRSLS